MSIGDGSDGAHHPVWLVRRILDELGPLHGPRSTTPHGSAVAVRDGTAPLSAYAPRPYTSVRWAGSVSTLRDAFAVAAPGATTVLVEIAPDPLPLRRVVGAQLLDTVVHTWDVGRGLGLEHVPGADLVAVVAAAAVPDDGRRDRPDAAFARSIPGRGTAWDRALARPGGTRASPDLRPVIRVNVAARSLRPP